MAYVSVEAPGKLVRSTPPKFIRNGRAGHPRHLLSAKAIDSDEVDDFCRMAEAFEIGSVSAPGSAGKTVALLFFQPTTRTRLGFEAATVALGAPPAAMEGMSASPTC